MLWLPGRRLHHGRLPEGLIIPLDSVSIPEDWERFTAPDGKHIIGAGSTYSPGDTGGDDNSFSGLTSTLGGAHTGSYVDGWAKYQSGGASGWGIYGGDVSYPGHGHDIGFDFEHAYRQLVLIRALSDRSIFPANGIVLSKESTAPHENLTICYNNGKIFRAAATIAAGGGSLSNVTCGSAGSHPHTYRAWGIAGSVEYSLGYEYTEGSNHPHSVQSSDLSDWELKRAYLTAWKGTSGFSLASGMIGMWESSTPPTGWVLCDGTNGTLDLEDYFIMLSAVETAGDQHNESNRILPSITLDNHGFNHSHRGSSHANSSDGTQRRHDSDGATHNHIYNSWTDYTPEYYALTFIQRI